MLDLLFNDRTFRYTAPVDKASEPAAPVYLNFDQLYLEAILSSLKMTQNLRTKLIENPAFAISFCKLCLLINVGRINTTLACASCSGVSKGGERADGTRSLAEHEDGAEDVPPCSFAAGRPHFANGDAGRAEDQGDAQGVLSRLGGDGAAAPPTRHCQEGCELARPTAGTGAYSSYAGIVSTLPRPANDRGHRPVPPLQRSERASLPSPSQWFLSLMLSSSGRPKSTFLPDSTCTTSFTPPRASSLFALRAH